MVGKRHIRIVAACAAALLTAGAGAAGAAAPPAVRTPSEASNRSWFAVAGAHPSARTHAATAYDAANHRTVLFGGRSWDGRLDTLLDDTWLFDGATRRWSEAHPATSPPARSNAAMTYDAAHHEVVLFSGSTRAALPGDTWTWDGTNWTEAHPASSPPAGANNVTTYDAARGTVMLYDGDAGTTWLWDGTNWTNVSTPRSPGVRAGFAMTYDVASKRVLLYGGSAPNGDRGFSTWLWDGTAWSAPKRAVTPGDRDGAVMSYDPVLRGTMLFGGSTYSPCSLFWLLSDTWLWRDGRWRELRLGSVPTPQRDGMTLAYDAANRIQVLFGGETYNDRIDDTWVFADAKTTFAKGLWTSAADGAVAPHGHAPSHGSPEGARFDAPIVGMAGTNDGYALVSSDGGVFTFGDAPYFGAAVGRPLDHPIVAMAMTNRNQGYYLLNSAGGILRFGKAFARGSALNAHLTHPAVAMATSRAGYWIVTSRGRVLTYGNLRFHGELPVARHKRAVGIAALPPPSGGCDSRDNPEGYWIATADGYVFAFGDAPKLRGAVGTLGVAHLVAITATPTGDGYWLTASDGRVFARGDAKQFTRLRTPPRAPTVGAAPFERVTVRPR